MSSVHLGRLAGNWLDLYADLLPFLRSVHWLVVHLNTGHDANLDELNKDHERYRQVE